MSTQAVAKQAINPASTTEARIMFRVLTAVSFCHVLNDMMQSLLPSIYPILKTSFHLNFTQIGFITLTFQITASLPDKSAPPGSPSPPSSASSSSSESAAGTRLTSPICKADPQSTPKNPPHCREGKSSPQSPFSSRSSSQSTSISPASPATTPS